MTPTWQELSGAIVVDPRITIQHIICTAVLVLSMAGCTVIRDDAGRPKDDELFAAGRDVSACTVQAHLKCIYLTGAETIADGRRAQWTRHWFRMSYIGRACEARYGKTTGIILESLFAAPHYLGIALGNTLSVALYPLRRWDADQSETEE